MSPIALPGCSELSQPFVPFAPLEKFGVKVKSTAKYQGASSVAQTDPEGRVLEEAEGGLWSLGESCRFLPSSAAWVTPAFPSVALPCGEELRVWKQRDQGSGSKPVSFFLGGLGQCLLSCTMVF